MHLLKSIMGAVSGGILMCGCTAAAIAMPASGLPRLNEATSGSQLPWVQAAGQENDHPAWSFGCAEPDISVRAIPCDDPVYVYGHNCEEGSGQIENPKPCAPPKPVAVKQTEPSGSGDSSGSGGFPFNPVALFNGVFGRN